VLNLVLPGCCVLLANGLRFQSSEADLGSWLARGLTGRLGGAVLKHFLQCTLLSAQMTWRYDAHRASSLQVGSCFCMGRNVEMWRFLANGQQCALNCWSDSFTQS